MNDPTKERGILMHARSVNGILEGRKTQTRRIVKPQPERPDDCSYYDNLGSEWYPIYGPKPNDERVRCPYGQPGDRLWARERWRVVGWHEGEPIVIGYADDARREEGGDSTCSDDYENWYVRMMEQSSADCEKAGLTLNKFDEYDMGESGIVTRWRPGIHMPRWASRITLEITDVRVERVQDISTEDIMAEGVGGDVIVSAERAAKMGTTDTEFDHRIRWHELWEDTNGKGAWERNDWVWVVEFRRVDQ